MVIESLDTVVDEACYRAMDWLIAVAPELSRVGYDNVADLLNLEVDLLFFDTTSTYFELDEPDEPVGRDEYGVAAADDQDTMKAAGFRTYGKSKDSRPDLSQIVIGMAVTRGEPQRPAACRRPLHPRREAARRLRRGETSPSAVDAFEATRNWDSLWTR